MNANELRRVNSWLERWARWVHLGSAQQAKSMLQVIMEGGLIGRGAGGAATPMLDCIEMDIEAALSRLSISDPKSVLVLRVEYGAKKLPNIPLDAPREQKALRLDMSKRTYERRLKTAREFIYQQVWEQKK